MPAKPSQQFGSTLSVLLIIMIAREIGSYPAIMKVQYYSSVLTIGLGSEYGTNFDSTSHDCLCANSSIRTPCGIQFDPISSPNGLSENLPQNLSSEEAQSYNEVKYFTCAMGYSASYEKEVSCSRNRNKGRPCSADSCSMNIIIGCSNGVIVTVVWESSQKASVLDINGATLIDCCRKTPTTTELSTLVTSSPTESTTPPTTSLTTTTVFSSLNTTEVFIVDTPGVTKREPVTPTSASSTSDYVNSDKANQEQRSNNDTQFSGVHIGVIVATAVAAIILTVLVMFFIFKVRYKRRNHAAEEDVPKISKLDLENNGKTSGNEGTDKIRANHNKPEKSVAQVSPLIQSSERESQYNQMTDDYTYIDATLATNNSSKSECIPLGVPVAVLETDRCMTSPESIGCESHDVYARLRTEKTALENPYNWLNYGNSDTASQHRTSKKLNDHYETPPVPMDIANKHDSYNIEQDHTGGDNIIVYSKLGETKVVYENPYDGLHNTTNDTPTHTVSIDSPREMKQKLNRQFETPPFPVEAVNKRLTSAVPDVTRSKTMEVVDVTPGIYADVIRATTIKKSPTSETLLATENQAHINTSSNGDQISRKAKPDNDSCDAVCEHNLGAVHTNVNTQKNSNPYYSSGIYSLEKSVPESRNISLPAEEAAYANLN